MFKRKFEEEAAPAEAAPAADPATALVEALTAMGLNAEQAEAVHQMAMDLVSAAPAEAPAEATEVEASRQRKSRMGRGRRSKMGRGRRSRYSRMSREDRAEFRKRRSARKGRTERTEMSGERNTIARQRRQIALMRKQLEELGSAPAAQKLSAAPNKTAPVASGALQAEGNSVKERVSNMVQKLMK